MGVVVMGVVVVVVGGVDVDVVRSRTLLVSGGGDPASVRACVGIRWARTQACRDPASPTRSVSRVRVGIQHVEIDKKS